MIRKLMTLAPAGLAALILAACSDSDPEVRWPVNESPPVERGPVSTSRLSEIDKEEFQEKDNTAQMRDQIRALRAMRQQQLMQQYRQAQIQQYYRTMAARRALMNAYAQQYRNGTYGSTGSYSRPGSNFTTYDRTGTSVYSDGSGVVGVMTPNGSWYPGQ